MSSRLLYLSSTTCPLFTWSLQTAVSCPTGPVAVYAITSVSTARGVIWIKCSSLGCSLKNLPPCSEPLLPCQAALPPAPYITQTGQRDTLVARITRVVRLGRGITHTVKVEHPLYYRLALFLERTSRHVVRLEDERARRRSGKVGTRVFSPDCSKRGTVWRKWGVLGFGDESGMLLIFFKENSTPTAAIYKWC